MSLSLFNIVFCAFSVILEQHLPVNGQSRDHHAAALLTTRDPAKVQAASQLPMGAQSHGEELPTGQSAGPPGQLG